MLHFFDTNILVYLFDNDAPDKKQLTQKLVEGEVKAGTFQTSTQVLQELYVVLTRKLAVPLAMNQAEQVIREFARLSVTQVDIDTILKSIQLQQRLKYSFWDSLIIQSAMQGGASIVYTEDMQNGQQIDELKIINSYHVLKNH
jgi:predicted nucleic acid-binding protein